MHISTQGCYAVMALIDIHHTHKEQGFQRPVSISEIAKNLHISVSYLEQIFARLRRQKVVRSVRGPGGGYVFARSPKDILLKEVLQAVSVPLVKKMANPKVSAHWGGNKLNGCPALVLWQAFDAHIAEFLADVTLQMVFEKSLAVGLPSAVQLPVRAVTAP